MKKGREFEALRRNLAEGVSRNAAVAEYRQAVPLITGNALDKKDIITGEDVPVDPLILGGSAVGRSREEEERRGVCERIPWWATVGAILCALIFVGLVSWGFERRRLIASLPPPILPGAATTSISTTTPMNPMNPLNSMNTMNPINPMNTMNTMNTMNPMIAPTTTMSTTAPLLQPNPMVPGMAPGVSTVTEKREISPMGDVNVARRVDTNHIMHQKEEGRLPTGSVGKEGARSGFTFDGKRYYCESGKEWNGSNCVRRQQRHLRRS